MTDYIKLHLGCGNVYLKDHINIDFLKTGTTKFAMSEPSLVEKLSTTADNYYKFNFKSNPNNDVTLVDVADDVRDLANTRYLLHHNNKKVSSILAVQILEHFTENEVPNVLKLWSSILIDGGEMYISVPDLKETARLLSESKTDKEFDWYSRLIYGSQKDQKAYHKSAFSYNKIVTLMNNVGIHDIKLLDNIHDYPAILVRGVKR
jgi:hypothetical protein